MNELKTVWGGIIVTGETDDLIRRASKGMSGKSVWKMPKRKRRIGVDSSFKKIYFPKNFGFNIFKTLKGGT